MPLNVRQTWLTRAAFDRVKRELAALITERHADEVEAARC